MTLDQLVTTARILALRGTFDGTINTMAYMQTCIQNYMPLEARVIFTRDTGHHTCGWWKNPDYERCYHLSCSFADGFAKRKGEVLARAFFGHDVRLLWIEPPYSSQGKTAGVWHYRLFCDQGWQPFKPTGEVYSRRMPEGWMSFSERHGNVKNTATPRAMTTSAARGALEQP